MSFPSKAFENINVYGTLMANNGAMYINNGNVGINTLTANSELVVSGNLTMADDGHGIIFPDGTIQYSADSGGAGSVNNAAKGSVGYYKIAGSNIYGTVTEGGTISTDGSNFTATRYLFTNTSNSIMVGSNYVPGDNQTGNEAIGVGTLMNLQTGNYNTAIGIDTMGNATGGDNNQAIGREAMYNNTTGNCNQAIGYATLYSNNTGYDNQAIGRQALYSNTGGTRNTAIGLQALYANTTGQQNMAVGRLALKSNNTGNWNQAFGDSTLLNNTTGNSNQAIGSQALFSNNSGSDNQAIGSHALKYNITGEYNQAIGSAALGNNISGQQNQAIGYQALYNNDTGSDNTVIGYKALFTNNGEGNIAMGNGVAYNLTNSNFTLNIGRIDDDTSLISATNYNDINTSNFTINTGQKVYASSDKFVVGANNFVVDSSGNAIATRYTFANDQNVSVGNDALLDITSGTLNTAVGSEALMINVGGDKNTAIGNDALKNNITSNQNTAVGWRSLLNNTTTLNTAVGSQSLMNNTGGTQNTAVGVNALKNNTSGNENTAMGYESNNNNLGGDENTSMGWGSIRNHREGHGNVAVGYKSLYGTYPQECDHNTAVGSQTLYSNILGSNNIAIGYRVGYNLTNSNYSLNIGRIDDDQCIISATNYNDISSSNLVFTASSVTIDGTFTSTEPKLFVIKHPDDSSKYLSHCCLEGPEGGVYYRGIGEIAKGKTNVIITLPSYVSSLVESESDMTVHVTPLWDGKTVRTLNVTAVNKGKFTVHGTAGSFNWVVHGRTFEINVEGDYNKRYHEPGVKKKK